MWIDHPCLMRLVSAAGWLWNIGGLLLMGEQKPGSVAAKELNLALAQLYNYIRRGSVKNLKADGWPNGKGIIVDMDEVRAAIASKPERKARSSKGSGPSNGRTGARSTKATKDLAHEIHEELDEETREKRARRRASGDEGNAVRLHRLIRGEIIPCPVDASHGGLLRTEDKKAKHPLFCPHQDHDGRTNHNPLGPLPPTQAHFTEDEARTPQPTGTLGVVMLQWIAEGRTDLSEGLETWLNKNKLPVWIPLR